MGYMGLSHWVESDGASDFRCVLQELFKKHEGKKTLKTAVRKLIFKETKNGSNFCNTDGVVNIALVMEDEGNIEVPLEKGEPEDKTPEFSKLLSKKEFKAILDGLTKLIKKCGPEDMSDKNTNWHRENFERLRKLVFRKTYKE